MWRYRRQRRAMAALGLLLLLAAAWLAVACRRHLSPVLAAMAQRQAEIIGVDTLSRSLARHLGGQIAYQDLIALRYDRQGQVSFMQVNTTAVNRLVAGLQQAIQQDLQAMGAATVELPLGLVLGSDLLAAYGPRFKVRIVPQGTVRLALDQAFTHAGINQTRHTIYLSVETHVRIMVPLHREDMVVKTKTPLVEAVIVGPVPDQYLNLDWSLTPWGREGEA
ncbi:MAG TPA: sporulation protein YunB [Sphingobacteriaceae bacterium]|nr:sporulation protein YunB [Sphingobacteriaceae bacterium]